jgi:SAM-dependent methyltransferase
MTAPVTSPVERFDAAWLARREALDARSRSHRLTGLAADWLAARPGPHRLVDLGSGSGSNPRFLAPRLPGPQRWRLVDHDAGLLALARRDAVQWRDDGGGRVQAATDCRDLARLDDGLLAGADLVVASALCDLVPRAWAEALVTECAAAGRGLLLTLSVDGDWTFIDRHGERHEDGEDLAVRTLFQAHQLRDKGAGPALGGEAPAVLASLAVEAGLRVEDVATPWQIAPGETAFGPLAACLVEGWCRAAREQTPAQAERLAAWRDARLAALAAGDLGIRVGHRDLLLLPRARA